MDLRLTLGLAEIDISMHLEFDGDVWVKVPVIDKKYSAGFDVDLEGIIS